MVDEPHTYDLPSRPGWPVDAGLRPHRAGRPACPGLLPRRRPGAVTGAGPVPLGPAPDRLADRLSRRPGL